MIVSGLLEETNQGVRGSPPRDMQLSPWSGLVGPNHTSGFSIWVISPKTVVDSCGIGTVYRTRKILACQVVAITTWNERSPWADVK